MRKTISGIALAITLLTSACSNENKTISTVESNKNEDTIEIKMPHNSPIVISKKDIIIYPLSLNKGSFKDYRRTLKLIIGILFSTMLLLVKVIY